MENFDNNDTLIDLPLLTKKQEEANKLLGSSARHILLKGGSRSGKTTLICRAICLRALKAPGSTHAILRQRFNHLKQSVIYDTMPKVNSLWFPYLNFKLNKSDWEHVLPNGSRIIYGGLDDKERTEKILGQEHSTIFLCECSQISFSARNKAVTRLAQNSGLNLKLYYDCNPPSKSHWVYKLFEKKVDAITGEELSNPDNFVSMLMNPEDNKENLPPGTIEELQNLTKREKDRFYYGHYLSAVDNALWPEDAIKVMARPLDGNTKEWQRIKSLLTRIIIAIDPSGSDGDAEKNNDDIGIIVVGILNDGKGILLEDQTGIYSPLKWAKIACDLYHKWEADLIVGESNFGGAMVESNVRTIDQHVNFELISVSRGKHIRAEPIAALYEKEEILHLGHFPDLEDEMSEFNTAGYQGTRSPNRADAMIMGFTELMLQKGMNVGILWKT